MFECLLEQGDLFRKIIGAISDLVQDGNFQINTNHIAFQGMDSSHVSLVALSLRNAGFKHYRCDRDITLGINFTSLSKVLKCMSSKDRLKLKCQDDGDTIFIGFENSDNSRVSNFELKLMEIEQDQLGIPTTTYAANASIPSSLFQKIVRDLSAIGDSIAISVNKQGIKFEVAGDIGKGDVLLSGNVKRVQPKDLKKSDDDDSKDDKKVEQSKDTDNDTQIKDENKQSNNAKTPGNNNNDDDMDEDDDMKDAQNKEEEKDDADMEAEPDAVDENEEDDADRVCVMMSDDVSQTYAVRYLQNFTKATQLSDKVTLSMGPEVPLKVHYKIADLGEIAYYLAPKIDDED